MELAGPAQELALVGRHLELVEDGVHRADRLAVGAVDAGLRVDVVHILFIGGGDAAHRADLDAGRVLNPDTGFRDNESQNFLELWATTSRPAVLLSYQWPAARGQSGGIIQAQARDRSGRSLRKD